jgi:hypothetical protein
MNDPLHALLPYLPLLIVLIVLFRRTQRPRIIKPGRLWIGPAIVLVAVGFYVVSAIRVAPPLQPTDWLVMLGTAALGVALGAVRAHSVRLQRRPDNGAIEGTLTAWGLIIIVLWMAGRLILRQSGWTGANTPFGLYTDATMSFLVGLVLAQAIVLTRRCQAVAAPV